jgi:hypothetical protein
MPDLEEHVLDGDDISVELLVRSSMRNSRRIDHFDEQICGVRAECQNMASAVENVHRVLQQFNHRLFDFGRELKRQSLYVEETFASVKSVLRIVGTLVSDIVTNLTQLGDFNHHLSSSCGSAFDEVVRLMNVISGRSFVNVHTIDEVALEASELAQNLHTQRFDLDMSKVLRDLDGAELAPAPSPREAAIPTYKRTLARVFDESVPGEKITRDPLVLLSLEELRVNLESYGLGLRKFVDDTSAELGDLREAITRKMDAESIDRLVKKLEGAVSQLKKGATDAQSFHLTMGMPDVPKGFGGTQASPKGSLPAIAPLQSFASPSDSAVPTPERPSESPGTPLMTPTRGTSAHAHTLKAVVPRALRVQPGASPSQIHSKRHVRQAVPDVGRTVLASAQV